MYKPIIVLFLSFLHFSGIGQQTSYTISPPIDVSQFRMVQQHLHSDASGHYVVFTEPKMNIGSEHSAMLVLEKYDTEFNLLFSKRYANERKGQKNLGMLYHNGSFLWIKRERKKKAKTSNYILTELTKEGEVKKEQILASISEKKTMSVPQATWIFSPDSSKMLLAIIHGENSKTKSFVATVQVYDANYEPIWQKSLEFKEKERQIKVLDWTLGNDSVVHYLLKKHDTPKGKEILKAKIHEKKLAAYGLHIGHLSANGQSEIKEVYDTDKFVLSAKLSRSPWDDIYVAGMVSDEPYSKPITEMFYARYRNKSLQPVFWTLRPFVNTDFEVFTERNTSKYYEEGQEKIGVLEEFKIRDISFHDGELITLISERERVDQDYLYSADISLMTLTNAGDMHTMHIIPKAQRANDADRMSSSLFKTNEKLYFFYNDNIENVRSKVISAVNPKTLTVFTDYTAVMVVYDVNSHKLTRVPLFRAKDVEGTFLPPYCAWLSDNRIFVFNERSVFGNKKVKLGVVSLTE